MSVLTHVIRKRQQWRHLSEIASRNQPTHSTFDKIVYVGVAILVYTYRTEVLGAITRFLESI